MKSVFALSLERDFLCGFERTLERTNTHRHTGTHTHTRWNKYVCNTKFQMNFCTVKWYHRTRGFSMWKHSEHVCIQHTNRNRRRIKRVEQNDDDVVVVVVNVFSRFFFLITAFFLLLSLLLLWFFCVTSLSHCVLNLFHHVDQSHKLIIRIKKN